MSEQFPILDHYLRPAKGVTVPWAFVAPHETQARDNHGQTLKRLAERGGLSWMELEIIVTDKKWDGRIFMLPKEKDAYIAADAAAEKRVRALLEIWCASCP